MESNKSTLIVNGKIVNEGRIFEADIYIKNGRIKQIGGSMDIEPDQFIDAEGKYIFPGIIDDQVHFREPGNTHKGSIRTESLAAIYGGVTSYMEMPNTNPPTTTQEALQNKYDLAAKSSFANYSFYMGVSNDNAEEVLKTNAREVCGVKIFMGSSTGNMLVDDEKTLTKIFANSPLLIATHCEDESTIRANEKMYRDKYGAKIDIGYHPDIRSEMACYLSSSFAVGLAKKYDSRLHVLHLSTAKEMELFSNDIPLIDKRITAEVCVHHLFFERKDYEGLGTFIKCNPAIKEGTDKDFLFESLLNNTIDVIATDHAPHTLEEKQNSYFNAPSGLPLVQHSLTVMLSFYHEGKISLEKIVEKMCHAPADCYKVKERGYIKEGYWADLIIVDVDEEFEVKPSNIHYKCSWSPLQGRKMKGKVSSTMVNGILVLDKGITNLVLAGKRLQFDR